MPLCSQAVPCAVEVTGPAPLHRPLLRLFSGSFSYCHNQVEMLVLCEQQCFTDGYIRVSPYASGGVCNAP